MASKTSPTGRTSNAALNIRDFHTMRPVPQQEIDRTSGKITQNMGY